VVRHGVQRYRATRRKKRAGKAEVEREVLLPLDNARVSKPETADLRRAVANAVRAVRLLKWVPSPVSTGGGAAPGPVMPSHRRAVVVVERAARLSRSVLSPRIPDGGARFGSIGAGLRVGPPPNQPIEVTPSRYALSRTSSAR